MTNAHRIAPDHRWFLASLFLAGAVGAVDAAVENEVSFTLFYLVAIGLASWFGSRRHGIVIAVTSAALWLAADVLGVKASRPLWIECWNTTALLVLFLFAAVGLSVLRQALAKEATLARTDPLTGLANLRAFLELAGAEMNRAERYHQPLSLAYMDLDNFKWINDHLGHPAGDELLRTVARAIRANIRRTDVAARLGGDEFAVVLPQTDPTQVRPALDKVRRAVTEAMAERRWPVTISIGVTTFATLPDSLNEMLRIADGLLARVKQQGKNDVHHEIWQARDDRVTQAARLLLRQS